ncbi:MAG: hypothetical protein Q7T79_03180 [bacterium]|nr:hypothetical protein [bacterium]
MKNIFLFMVLVLGLLFAAGAEAAKKEKKAVITIATATVTATVTTIYPCDYGVSGKIIYARDQLVKTGQKGIRRPSLPEIRGNFNRWKDEPMKLVEGFWLFELKNIEMEDLVFCISLGEQRYLPEEILEQVEKHNTCRNGKGSWNFYFQLPPK